MPPSVNPGSCNKQIPFLGRHLPTVIKVLTTLWKLSWELWLPATSVTPCTRRRGAAPALQTLCLTEAPVALGVLHAMQCKSNSVCMLRRNKLTKLLVSDEEEARQEGKHYTSNSSRKNSTPYAHTELDFILLLPCF